jgi:hypothetical protein
MSNMQVLGTVVTSGTATANMVQGEPNPATGETDVNMDVDGVTTDEEDGDSLIITKMAPQLPLKPLPKKIG